MLSKCNTHSMVSFLTEIKIVVPLLQNFKCNTHSMVYLLTEIKIVVHMLQNFKNSIKNLVPSRADRGLWWLFLAKSWTV